MLNWFGPRFFFLQGLHLIFILLWLGLSAAALLSLRKRHLSDVARVLWTIFIVIIPLLGAAAYWLMLPGQESGGAG
jgi:hypothetical protein